MSGYCATGSANMATPPITIIKMASTFARTGRAMKKSEIMAPWLFGARARGRRRSGGRKLRIDLLTRDRPQDAGNDDTIVGLESALDHAQVADPGADRDLALLDGIVVVEHEQITSALVAAERGIRYQQRLLLVGGANSHAHEIARRQHLLGIRQDGADGKRSGRPVDGGRNVVQRAPIRISLVGLQPDFDRIRFEVLRGHAEAPHVRANVQHLLLVDIEVHVNRSGLLEVNEIAGLGWQTGARGTFDAQRHSGALANHAQPKNSGSGRKP